MEKRVFVVTYSIDESVWDESWTNYDVVGCFYDEKKAEGFALEYEQKIRDKHKNQIGWGSPNCEVHETTLQ